MSRQLTRIQSPAGNNLQIRISVNLHRSSIRISVAALIFSIIALATAGAPVFGRDLPERS
jgi:hypothetical protein